MKLTIRIIILTLTLFLITNIKAQSIESHSIWINTMVKSYIIPLDSIDQELNVLIKKHLLDEHIKPIPIHMTGIFIRVNKCGKIKRIIWNEEYKAIGFEKEVQDIVEKYFFELKYFNNAYRNEFKKTKHLKEIIFMYTIDMNGNLKNHIN